MRKKHTAEFKSKVALYVVGSGIPHIYFKDYGCAQIYCPDIMQQKKC